MFVGRLNEVRTASRCRDRSLPHNQGWAPRGMKIDHLFFYCRSSDAGVDSLSVPPPYRGNDVTTHQRGRCRIRNGSIGHDGYRKPIPDFHTPEPRCLPGGPGSGGHPVSRRRVAAHTAIDLRRATLSMSLRTARGVPRLWRSPNSMPRVRRVRCRRQRRRTTGMPGAGGRVGSRRCMGRQSLPLGAR